MKGVPGSDIVRAASWLVPWRRRAEWRAEWSAELAHAWRSAEPSRWSALRLRGRALGAVRDAFEVRRQHAGGTMLGSDVKFAARMVARRPAFSAALVLTLALGVGGAAAIYTVLDRVLLRPPPFADVTRLVELHTVFGPDAVIPVVMSDAVAEWQRQPGLFDAVEAYAYRGVVLAGAGEPLRATVALVTPGLLALLGARPLLGRLPDGDAAGGDEIVIAESLWRRQLGADDAVIGRRITLDERAYTVVGVLPEGFRYPAGEPRAWLPARLGEEGTMQVHPVARVRTYLTRDQVTAEVARLAPLLEAERPTGFPYALQLRWLADSQVRPELQRALWLLAGAVVLVLLIACANAGNLLLVDTARRERELSIRGALGATRVGIVRQLLLESMLLGLLSAGAGLLIAHWLVRGLLALVPPEIVLTSFHRIEVDVRVVLFATSLSLCLAILYSLVPALRAAHRAELLRTGRNGAGSRRYHVTRSSLVVAEVALSVVLVTGAGLLLNSFMRLMRADVGFQPAGLIAFPLFPRSGGEAFMEEVERRLRALPDVAELARGDAAPSEASYRFMQFVLQTDEQADAVVQPEAGMLPVLHADTAYVRVIGAQIREGRNIEPEDARTNGVLIDSDLARRLWPDGAAVGRRFRTRRDGEWWHVVGVTNDIRLLGPDQRAAPWLVIRHAPAERRGAFFVLRTRTDEAAATAGVQRVLRELDPGLPLPRIERVTQTMRSTFAERRFFMVLIGGFAVVSVLLAVIGLYGVIAHAVAQRTREIGIRMALGARAAVVMREVLRGGAALVLLGVAIGAAGGLFAARLLAGLLFGVPPHDAPTFAAVVLTVSAIALLATLLPARRAARVQPVIALRAE